MAIISDEPYEKKGGEDSGRDSLNFTPEQHHVSAVDTPTGGDPGGGKAVAHEEQETVPKVSRAAHEGASWAVEHGSLKGDSMPFTTSSGCFTSGPSVGSHFHDAIARSGGVRQGTEWVSEAAPGVYRCTEDHTLTLDSLSKPDENGHLVHQGAAHTFEEQRHSHWSHDKWGG